MAARLCAVGCALLAAAALVYIHRDDLFSGGADAIAADPNDPFQICFADRAADIDGMVAEGTISGDQAVAFKARAEAMCRDIAGGNNQVPSQ